MALAECRRGACGPENLMTFRKGWYLVVGRTAALFLVLWGRVVAVQEGME